MNIFGNTGFSKEVDNAMPTFKSTITKLQLRSKMKLRSWKHCLNNHES